MFGQVINATINDLVILPQAHLLAAILFACMVGMIVGFIVGRYGDKNETLDY